MFDCSCLYSDNYVNRKNKMLVKLEKHGVAHVRLKEKEFDGFGIYELCQNIYYIINTYKKACKSIVITCNEFNPTDKLTYILFETILFDLIINRSYDVKFRVKECKTNIMTDGMRDSTLNYHYMYAQNVDKYQKKFKFEQNRIHFRRLFTKEQSEGSGISSLLGELKTFFITSQLGKSNTDQLANVISELVDNVGEHTESDCLVDIDISESPYFKAGEGDVEYLAVNTVVLNFGGKCLCDDMRKKIQNHYFENSNRYNTVECAYNNHKLQFGKEYNEEDFFNVVSFQDEISGRKGETTTGGTGLTQLIKSLESNAEEHGCYVLSGKQGLFFHPSFLEYNDDNWLGFNEKRDFITEIPNKEILLRSKTFLRGTGYNFTLVYRR